MYCLELGNDNTPCYQSWAEELCIACQHCMAVCPQAALSIDNLTPAASFKTSYGNSAALLGLIQSRRSMRHFKDEEIPKDLLAKIEAMLPFTPTASNTNSLHFALVMSQEKMAAIRQATYAQAPLFSMISSKGLQRYDAMIAKGEDFIYRGAPVMLAVAALNERMEPPFHGLVDASIALTLVDLYAQSLGLGVVWCGLALHAALTIPKVLDLLEIPKAYTLCYTMLLGMPAVKYPRTVQPEPFSIKRL